MKHLDEATVAEFLDEGQSGRAAEVREIESHVAECDECRALLEEQRRLRDRAQAILSGSGPADVAAPPFEQVLAQSGRTSKVTQLRRWRVVAWAASISIAAAVGWYARDAALRQPVIGEPALSQPSVDQLAPTGLASATPEDTSRESAAEESESDLPQPPAEPEAPAQVGGVSPKEGTADPVPPVAARVLTADRAQEQANVAGAGERRARAEAPAPTVAAELGRGVAGAVEMQEAFRQDVGDWTEVSRDSAEASLGGSLYLIEGLTVVRHDIVLAPEVRVRTVQSLVGESRIELFQWAAEPDLDDLARRSGATGDETELRVSRDGFVILGSGPYTNGLAARPTPPPRAKAIVGGS